MQESKLIYSQLLKKLKSFSSDDAKNIALKYLYLKYDIDRLREYEERFKISNPKDEYNKVVKVKNNFNKILTTV